ncbi:MAG: hypothetical protein AAGG72_01200 [Pseudomonadota bacterium]
MRSIAILAWSVLSAGWFIVVAFLAERTWPVLSLDLSHSDPATQAAFNTAVYQHIGWHAALAVVPTALVLIAILAIFRRPRGSQAS